MVMLLRTTLTLASALLMSLPTVVLTASTAHAEQADAVPGPSRVDAGSIALGDSFGCVIVTDGSVRCWGNGSFGVTAQGNADDVGDDPGESTVRVPLPAPVKSLAAGGEFACAILDTGQLRCWGSGGYGAFAAGNEQAVGDDPGEVPVPIDLGPGRTAVAVSAGQQHACAILDNGQVRCWGNNASGQLGQGFSSSDIGADPGEKPVLVSLPRRPVAIASTDWANCVVLDNGELRCWGRGGSGELRQGDTENWGDDPDELTPVQLTVARKAVAVTGGGTHFCAVLDDRRVRCWGESDHGQLGLGRTAPFGDGPGEDSVGPVDLPPGRLVTAAVGGQDNSCAVLDTGHLRCWGRNQSGQLGQGNTASWGDDAGESTLAVDVGGPVRAVGVGEDFACAVTGAGLRCWGENDDGRLAQGSGVDYGGSPGEVPRLLPAVKLGGLQVGRDRDRDGVRDAVDACPAVAGSLANGCPPPPQAVLEGKKVVIDTVLAKKKASATCPAKATVKVTTKTKKGRLTVVKQLKTTKSGTGCSVKGKVRLGAKPKSSARTRVTITGTKLKTKRLVAVRL